MCKPNPLAMSAVSFSSGVARDAYLAALHRLHTDASLTPSTVLENGKTAGAFAVECIDKGAARGKAIREKKRAAAGSQS